MDEPVARPLLAEFEKRTGIHVTLVPDTEASKTAGLAARLEAEKSNPQADVWWSNEPFHTINLAESGVLAEYDFPSAADIPAEYKDPKHQWACSALRARVVAVWTGSDAIPPISRIQDLTNPALKGKIAMATPGIGTVGGHVAALYVLWGDDRADAFFRALRANDVKLLGGNSVVADTVSRGQLWAGLTDNDDVENATHEGGRAKMVVPDQATPDADGTLLVPCSTALVAGAKHADAAKKLIDYLLSADVEKQLVAGKFALQSVRDGHGAIGAVKGMRVNYAEVARAMPRAIARSRKILEDR